MSNLLTPVELHLLEAVTAGANTSSITTKTTTQRSSSGSSDQILQTLNSLSSTIKDIASASNASGFSTTQILMLGLLLNQQRQVNVFVRRPYW
jgi:hypothetical protein